MSVLSLRHPGLRMGYDAMRGLYEDLGRRQGPVLAFEQALVDRSSGLVAIDGHVVGAGSRENGLAAKGYKFAKLGEPQMNLLMAFDASTNAPLLSRMYEGAALDRVDVADLLAQARFEGVIFVVDRGFYSEGNVELLTRAGNHYVVPLSKGLKACREAVSSLEMQGRFVWQRGSKATVVEYKEDDVRGRRVLTYRDLSESAAMQANYLRHLGRGDRAYTQERFDELAPLMGVTVLQTSLPASERDAEAVYGLYRRRLGRGDLLRLLQERPGRALALPAGLPQGPGAGVRDARLGPHPPRGRRRRRRLGPGHVGRRRAHGREDGQGRQAERRLGRRQLQEEARQGVRGAQHHPRDCSESRATYLENPIVVTKLTFLFSA
jgi:hypothetical protein